MATIQVRKSKDGIEAFRAIVRKTHFNGSATFETERAARAWGDAMEALADKGKDGNDPDAAITLATPVRVMLQKYRAEVIPTHRGKAGEGRSLDMLLDRYAAFDKPLCDFDYQDVQRIINHRMKGDKRYAAVSAGTVIRNISLLSGAFTHCRKMWCKLHENPCKNTVRPTAPAHRVRRVSDEETAAVCKAAGYVQGTKPETTKQYIAWAFLFARTTAMRRGEILSLTRERVFVAKMFAHLPMTKNGSSRDVPLNSTARALLALLDLESLAPTAPLIPLKENSFATIWNHVRNDSKVPNLRFHDTRHEATTQLAKRLTNVLELSSVTGHKSLKMLQIYFNPTATELADRMG